MKKILILSLSFVIFSIAVHAQTTSAAPQSSAQPASKNHKKADKTSKGNRLNMTSDQRKQMHQIKETQKEKKNSIVNNNNLSDAQKQQQLKSLKTQTKGQKNKVLTPNQRDMQKQMKDQKKANKQESRIGKKGHGKKSAAPSLQ